MSGDKIPLKLDASYDDFRFNTSHVPISLFNGLAKKILPEYETFQTSDESLIRATIRAG